LRGTATHALCFGDSNIVLQGYVDSDMESDKDNKRSTTRYVFTVGGTMVSFILKLQKVFSLSTIEAEYVVATEASKQMIWLHSFMEELGKKQENRKLYCDNQSVIHIAKKLSFHSKTNHIQLRYHFIRFILEDRQLKLEKIHTNQNPPYMLTKVITRETEFLISSSWPSSMKVNMRNFPGPRWIIVQQVEQQWSCCDQSPSGRLLVVEPDYLPDLEVLFQLRLDPIT
jgi:hypothetical protein